MAEVLIQEVAKAFGPVQALDQINLDVHDGEFLTILGPSGSGKTTLLRLIAGLEAPDAGRIVIGGQVVCAEKIWVPPQQRDIGMVFQNYALWPHMTAFDNVAFPLEMAGLRAAEIKARVREVMALVELTGLEQKRPGEMSGGEQQRVAVARALVSGPSILLMDECLSNLDARLREKMAAELRRIQETTGVTTIYVTHDQHEALALSDRIAVLHHGALQQVDTPGQLYQQPSNPLVATALGSINLLTVAQVRQLGLPPPLPTVLNDDAILGVRPENVLIMPVQFAGSSSAHPAIADNPLPRIIGTVTKVTFMGNAHHYWIEVEDCLLHAGRSLPSLNNAAFKQTEPLLSAGDQAWVIIDPQSWIVLSHSER